MENNKYPVDCFDKKLNEGDDILISVNNTFKCGIIHNITDEYIEYDEQLWIDDEEVIIHHQEFFNRNGYKFRDIYKL